MSGMIRIIIVIIIIIIRIIIQIIIIIRIIIMITTLIMMTIKIISLTRIRIMIFLLANIIIKIRISMINMLIDHLDMDYHHNYHVDHDFDDDEKAVDMWEQTHCSAGSSKNCLCAPHTERCPLADTHEQYENQEKKEKEDKETGWKKRRTEKGND